ncbi:unnamed protein product [Dibothriocephalus latus]|uniref:Uncharacterized protein n=1 Tax=Dibothriocephalus latus TaxID=60516 RepID=A0A3P7P3Q2_DIBLA|nr:unnamed protein product [Dibothriocephalus latus]
MHCSFNNSMCNSLAGLTDDTPFDTLCYRLSNRIANTNSLRDALQHLNSRKLRQAESITNLVYDIKRLTTAAFLTIDGANNENPVIRRRSRTLN